MSTTLNLFIDQGTTFSVTIAVTNNDGTARDLTGYTARSQMRRSYATVSNTAFTVTINPPSDGEIELSLTSNQTSLLKAARYVYDLELVSNTNSVERIVEGIVTVNPEVTR